jgi:cation:H+ antiporter
MNLLMIVGGLVLLYFGAEWLVSGASRLALSLRISQLTVGLTVVAYGTSAPEVIVGVQASRTGHGDVALGNAIGSNIANLGLILAIAILVRPARVASALARREVPVLAISTVVLPLLLADGALSVIESAVMLLSALAYTIWMVRAARADELTGAREAAQVTAETAEVAGAPVGGSRVRLAVIALVGLAVLLLGGQLFVTGAVALARWLGMSERVVGLTIVSIGTSLPELATTVLAARRGHSDIALGNVVGSNIFNVLLCLSAAGLAGPIRTTAGAISFDVAVLLAMTCVAVVFMRGERTMQRREALLLLLGFASFIATLLVRGA